MNCIQGQSCHSSPQLSSVVKVSLLINHGIGFHRNKTKKIHIDPDSGADLKKKKIASHVVVITF